MTHSVLMANMKNLSGDHLVTLKHDEANKTLGLLWNAKLDCNQFTTQNKPQISVFTKRQVLSQIAKLGLLSPVVIKAKLIMQHMGAKNRLGLKITEIINSFMESISSATEFIKKLKNSKICSPT